MDEFIFDAENIYSFGGWEKVRFVCMDGANKESLRMLQISRHVFAVICVTHTLDCYIEDIGGGGSKEKWKVITREKFEWLAASNSVESFYRFVEVNC